MATIPSNGHEFTFFPPGVEDGEAQYRAVANPASVVFLRIGSDLQPIDFDVPRSVATSLGVVGDLENIVRHAIGQALRDHVFDDHPADTVYLDGDAPRWLGNLTKVQQRD